MSAGIQLLSCRSDCDRIRRKDSSLNKLIVIGLNIAAFVTGSDTKHDRNLGIFYQDDINKQRWILKSNDAKTLSQIDSVFVTVEPNRESAKPSGKPLLFTYLRMTPNHP
jgi:hypothetical protein